MAGFKLISPRNELSLALAAAWLTVMCSGIALIMEALHRSGSTHNGSVYAPVAGYAFAGAALLIAGLVVVAWLFARAGSAPGESASSESRAD